MLDLVEHAINDRFGSSAGMTTSPPPAGSTAGAEEAEEVEENDDDLLDDCIAPTAAYLCSQEEGDGNELDNKRSRHRDGSSLVRAASCGSDSRNCTTASDGCISVTTSVKRSSSSTARRSSSNRADKTNNRPTMRIVRFDGSMSQVQRNSALMGFQNDPSARILLISLK